LVLRARDPVSGRVVASRRTVRLPALIEVGDGHISLLTMPDGSEMLLRPGVHELLHLRGQADVCWMRLSALPRPGNRPMLCAISITSTRTEDGYCVGLLVGFTLRIWEPRTFRDALLPRKGLLGSWELEMAVRQKLSGALAKAVSYCHADDMESRLFASYLKHHINLRLKELGLRLASLDIMARRLLGPIERQEELLMELRKDLPLPLDEDRALMFKRKAEEIARKPWLLIKPLNPAWAREWRAFWASLVLDFMWSKGRFLLRPSDLASIEPFSLLKDELREELFDSLRRVVGSANGLVFSEEILKHLSSALARWACDKGLYVLERSSLESLLDLSRREAEMVLEHMVSAGACEWLKRGISVLVLPRTS